VVRNEENRENCTPCGGAKEKGNEKKRSKLRTVGRVYEVAL